MDSREEQNYAITPVYQFNAWAMIQRLKVVTHVQVSKLIFVLICVLFLVDKHEVASLNYEV